MPWFQDDDDEEDGPRGEPVVVRGLILVRETDAAWLVRVPDDPDTNDGLASLGSWLSDAPEIWLPKSRAFANFDGPGSVADAEMPKWLAENEGLDWERI